jgi:cytochrome P450
VQRGMHVYLYVRDPEIVNEIYGSKASLFSKHDLSENHKKYIFGDSVLMMKSDTIWREKRKILTSAFGFEKLKFMT